MGGGGGLFCFLKLLMWSSIAWFKSNHQHTKSSSTTILVPTSLFGAIEIERLQRMYVIGILSSQNHCVTFCEVVGASVKTNRFCFVLFFLFRLGLYGLLTALTLPFACSIVCQHVHGWIVNIFSDHIRNRYQLVISYDTATYSIRSTISPITPHYYSHFCRLFIFLLLQCSNAHYYIVVYCYSASIWCTAITINIIQTNITFNGSTIKMILFFFVLSLFQTILIPSSVYNVYYANYRLQGNVALNTI